MPYSLDLESHDSSSSSASAESEPKESMPPPSRILVGGKKPEVDSFWKRQAKKFKETVWVGGSFYNITMACLATFIGVFLALLALRPPMVMTTPEPDEKTGITPDPCFSPLSALVWAAIAAVVVLAITFFTRPKKSPNYVVAPPA